MTEEQIFIDKLAGNERYYRIIVNGYGGESAYLSISKEAHDFWKDHQDQYGDSDLVEYMVNAEESDFDFDELEAVPTEAEFLTDSDGDPRPWFEAEGEFEHTHGVAYDSAWVCVDEMSNDDCNSDHVNTVIDREEIGTLVERIYEESGDEGLEIQNYSCCDEPDEDVKYIAQMYSIEKGCFFDGVVTTYGEFDPSKLRFDVVEYLNGEDTLTCVYYDGEEVENMGGDTNGKGYSASVWEV